MLRVTGLCKGNPNVTDVFPSQRASNTENISIQLRHVMMKDFCIEMFTAILDILYFYKKDIMQW